MILALLSFISLGCATPYKSYVQPKYKFYSSVLSNDAYKDVYDDGTQTVFSPLWPVDEARLTQVFAPPRNPSHDGIDLASKIKTPILAADEGHVVFAGAGFNGYGKLIIIKHNKTWSTLYAHLNQLFVRTGDRIRRGDVIGLMGRTGKASGVHLHFEVLRDKIPVDPLTLLPQVRSLISRNN